MQAILYIGHGTRLQAGVLQCIEFIRKVEQSVNVPIQETAFLELVEPTIENGVKRCVKKGATSIAIMPLLLLTAHHAKLDIPQGLQEVRKLYPHIKFTYGSPLGVETEMIETVIEKVETITEQVANVELQLREGDADLLLVIRGSSDVGLAQQVEEICQRIREKTNYKQVKSCYLYGAGWRFDEALESYQLNGRPVVIVPYLLFDGLLSVGVEKKVVVAQKENPHILLSEKIGHGEKVQQLVLRRIEQCLQTGGVTL